MGEMPSEFMLRDEIATEIVHISRRLMQRTARAMESLNVGFGQAAILKVLSDHGEMAQRRLAEEIRVTPATVCGTLKRMERAGLIQRTGDESDARVSIVQLTEKGESCSEEAVRLFTQTDTDMLQGFSGEELAQLKGYLERMGENVNRALEAALESNRTDGDRR